MSLTLPEKQEEMRQRVKQQHEMQQKMKQQQRAIPVVKDNSLLPPTQIVNNQRKLCISCNKNVARLGTVYCSRCTASGLVNKLRDTLPGLPVPVETNKNLNGGQDNEIRNRIAVAADNSNVVQFRDTSREEDEVEDKENTELSLDGEKEKLYTRAEVAKMFEVSPNTIGKWERLQKIPASKRTYDHKCIYTQELVDKIAEHMKSYTPAYVSSAPTTPTGRLPFAVKKGMKVNRRLERAVANRIGTGRSTL